MFGVQRIGSKLWWSIAKPVGDDGSVVVRSMNCFQRSIRPGLTSGERVPIADAYTGM